MIGVIDYGLGNLQSVQNALEFLNIPHRLVVQPSQIKTCNKLILPGVGAFGQAMEKLGELGFVDELTLWVHTGKPLLGICLGMQLLFESSCEFGQHQGLGFIPGTVRSLKDKVGGLSVPHIGWNNVLKVSDNTRLLSGLNKDETFYFVHSYYCDPTDKKSNAAETCYGIRFTSVVENASLYGCQFHPEKSQRSGLVILKNYWKLC